MSFWQHFKPLIDCLRGGGGSRGDPSDGQCVASDMIPDLFVFLVVSPFSFVCFSLSPHLLDESSRLACQCRRPPPLSLSLFLFPGFQSLISCVVSFVAIPQHLLGLTCPQLPEDFVFLWRKIAFPSKTMINNPPFWVGRAGERAPVWKNINCWNKA